MAELGKGKVAVCSFPERWESSPPWVPHGGVRIPERCSACCKEMGRRCLLPQPSPSSGKVFPVARSSNQDVAWGHVIWAE